MILDESQPERDRERAALLNIPIERVVQFGLATPESIRIYDGSQPAATRRDYESLYRFSDFLDLPAYLRTLMMTSVLRRHPELFQIPRQSQWQVCPDFGSGAGTHALALLGSNNDVILLDVPGPLIDFAPKRICRRGFTVAVLRHDEPIPENHYDLVVCTDVLEHVYDPVGELLRITNALKPGGLLHLQVSTMFKPSSGHFKESIEKWIAEGSGILAQRYEVVGETLFRRRRQ